ncbi:zinc-dependent metalloprotease [Streptomyces nanshensis]|uniref:DUF2268 domain-containing protein n=1 Tax=Streptomyces nanshensis TaxID=518642 RepID=A0A1E7LA30_9ACTN|nr:zinc-dependent metalloprotease [Streptomyces nanshensis]OEV13000.1 hypothetical protein AN218_05685 [Streptomyces nanshensis]
MSDCDVRVETEDDRDAELAEQVEKIAAQVIPVLEDVTGLSVGEKPVIRIVTPAAWVTIRTEWRDRVHARLGQEFDLTDEEIQTLEIEAISESSELPLMWALVMGSTHEDESDEPQVLLVPSALHHCGFEEPELTKVAARELTHIAQHRAGDGAAFRARNSVYRERIGLQDIQPDYLLSGHSRWTDLAVTKRLLGREVSEDTGRQTEFWWSTAKAAAGRYQENPEKFPGKDLGVYRDGARWIADVVDLAGRDVLNRAWQDVSMIPTTAEIADPRAWLARVDGTH